MKDLFIALKTHIQETLPEIQKVGLYNNQFGHLNSDKPDEVAIRYPAVFIEMDPINYKENAFGLQTYEMRLTTHLGFESLKTEDVDILRIKQTLYNAVQRFRQGNFDKLIRYDEEPNYNHGNFQVYKTHYRTFGKDYSMVDLGEQMITGFTLSVTAQTAN